MKISIGIDVSMDSLDVAFPNKGKTFSVKKYSNDKSGISKLVDALSQAKPDAVVMEATGSYHFKLAYALFKEGFPVSVVNPLSIKRYSQSKLCRAKTDQIDAQHIAEYGMQNDLPLFEPRNEQEETLRILLNTRGSLMKDITRYKNRILAANRCPFNQSSLNNGLTNIINSVKAEIINIDQRINNIITESSTENVKLLEQIPGIGRITQALFLGPLGGLKKFEHYRQVIAFLGLNPSVKESGKSVRGSGVISRMGNSYYRSLLYMAALSAKRYNKPCSDFYERLLARGKCKKKALVAVANKLIKQIFSILKYQRNFDPNFSIKLREKLAFQDSLY